LDGETNLKLKNAVSVTQKYDEAALARLRDDIDEALPNNDLYASPISAPLLMHYAETPTLGATTRLPLHLSVLNGS
jgi:hypothetical protein